MHGIRRPPVRQRHPLDLFPGPAGETTRPAHPEVSIGAFGEIPEHGRRPAVRQRKKLEPPIVPSPQATPRAHPQVAAPILVEREDVVRDEPRSVGQVEDDEAHAVEARQSVGRAHPQIAVARLDDGAHRVVRHPVGRGPVPHEIFSRRSFIRRRGRGDQEPQHEVQGRAPEHGYALPG